MKLKNKKTGKIKEWSFVMLQNVMQITERKPYNSLAELNEEWEDYEEPKEYWYVSCGGRVLKATPDEDDYNEKHNAGHKQIGNYFETEEEAEKVVEKLKAWKRLKDKGFDIYSWEYEFTIADQPSQTIILRAIAIDHANEDLDLLFGGEE